MNDLADIKNIRRFIENLPSDTRISIRKAPPEVCKDDILPFDLYKGKRQNLEIIADQINKSFQYEVYDGTAVLMRRLIEMLLILSFKVVRQEDSIRDDDGNYLQLSYIINKAIQNKSIDLSRNSKSYLGIFKEKGDLSAHNPFHNCRRKDLELIQPKYRHLIEELLYKADVIK